VSSARRLAPGVALAAAGAVALAPAGPSWPTPVPAPAGTAVPAVHIADVQLAGIGQDIYEAITPYVQYVVGGVSYLINFIPLIGGPIAAQININYFQGVQPVVEATVNYLAAVVQNPFTIIGATGAYGEQLYGIAYNWVNAELRFLGLPQLPPLSEPEPGRLASSAGRVAAAAAVAAPSPAATTRGEVTTARADMETAAPVTEGSPVAEPPADVTPGTAARAVHPSGVRSPGERARSVRSGAGNLRGQPGAAAATGPADAAGRADSTGQRRSARAARAAA